MDILPWSHGRLYGIPFPLLCHICRQATMASGSNNRKSLLEMPTPAVPFSYAQAAKGIPPASTASPQSSSVPSEIMTPAKDGVPSPQPLVSDMPAGTSWADVGNHSSPTGSAKEMTSQSSESTVAARSQAPAVRGAHQRSSGLASPSSPDFGASSISTLPREDDVSSAQNIPSSESTWDSKSQTSVQEKGAAAAEKANEKGKDGAEQEDEEPSPQPKPVLQEAPIPVVNFWKQRAAEKHKGGKPGPSMSAGATPVTSVPVSSSTTSAQVKAETREIRTEAGHPTRKDSVKIHGEEKTGRHHGDRSVDDPGSRTQKPPRSREKTR